MNIGIIGGGSIGLLLSSYFAPNHNVTLYVRRKTQINDIEQYNIQLFLEGVYERSNIIDIKRVEDLTDHDCLFICVKQPELKNIIPMLTKVSRDVPIIFLQNGMGHIKTIHHLAQRTYVGIIEHGASRLTDHAVNHLGMGQIVLAPYTGNEKELTHFIHMLHEESFPIVQNNNWEKLLAHKLIVNAVINPLTALFNIPNGDIISNGHVQALARYLCKEVASVLKMNDKESWDLIHYIAWNTRYNVSSMRADILAKRETEIEAITGYILEQGEYLPYNKFVYESILALTEKGRKE